MKKLALLALFLPSACSVHMVDDRVDPNKLQAVINKISADNQMLAQGLIKVSAGLDDVKKLLPSPSPTLAPKK